MDLPTHATTHSRTAGQAKNLFAIEQGARRLFALPVTPPGRLGRARREHLITRDVIISLRPITRDVVISLRRCSYVASPCHKKARGVRMRCITQLRYNMQTLRIAGVCLAFLG